MAADTDRIEKQIVIEAPPARVWRALTDPAEFGEWFGVRLAGAFAPGANVTGQITHPGCEKMAFSIDIERMDPEQLFSYRWAPCEDDPSDDGAAQISTLVEFRLEPVGDSTQLTIVESGFDRLPADRREEAFRRNEGGWAQQIESVKRHVTAG